MTDHFQVVNITSKQRVTMATINLTGLAIHAHTPYSFHYLKNVKRWS